MAVNSEAGASTHSFRMRLHPSSRITAGDVNGQYTRARKRPCVTRGSQACLPTLDNGWHKANRAKLTVLSDPVVSIHHQGAFDYHPEVVYYQSCRCSPLGRLSESESGGVFLRDSQYASDDCLHVDPTASLTWSSCCDVLKSLSSKNETLFRKERVGVAVNRWWMKKKEIQSQTRRAA